MKLVKSFLCCLRIEIGGFVIGYLTLTASLAMLGLSIFLLIEGMKESFLPLLYIWISVVYCFASVELIKATKMRSSEKVFLFLVMTFLSCLIGVGITIYYLVDGVEGGFYEESNISYEAVVITKGVVTAIECYIAVIVFSLRATFIEEQYPIKGEVYTTLVP